MATESVTVVDPVPLTAAGLAENEQLAPRGRFPQLSEIGCEKPPTGAMVSVKGAGVPAGTDAEGGSAPIVKSVDWPTAVPVRRMLCGLPGALSLIVMAPMLWPGADGL